MHLKHPCRKQYHVSKVKIVFHSQNILALCTIRFYRVLSFAHDSTTYIFHNNIMDIDIFTALLSDFFIPLARIIFFVAIGLVIAQLIESLAWTRKVMQVSAPITRMAHFSSTATAAFSLAFVSGVSANSLLAEGYSEGRIQKKELVLANLLNSLPRFFLHLPTVFFLTLPFIKSAALTYVGITFLAALAQTLLVIVIGRLNLEKSSYGVAEQKEKKKIDWKQLGKRIVKRLKRRMKKLLLFMVPIYLLFFLLTQYGVLEYIEHAILDSGWFLSWLPPQSLGIIILHVTAEFSAGLAAASVLLASNTLSPEQIVMALLVGNLLATPIRALRHQFPYYTGIYPFKLAMELILVSQGLRVLCLGFISFVYFQLAF